MSVGSQENVYVVYVLFLFQVLFKATQPGPLINPSQDGLQIFISSFAYLAQTHWENC